MAVAFDAASSTGGAGASVTSLTWSHTCAAGAILYASVSIDGTSGTNYNASATYNGSAMTRIVNLASSGQYLAVFRHTAPATGANNVVISWASGNFAAAGSVSVTGADTGSPDTTPQTSEAGSGASASKTVSSAAGDLVLDFASVNNNDTLTSTQTSRVMQAGGTGGITTTLGIGSAAGAASVNIGWSWAGSNRHAHAAFSVNAAAGSADEISAPAIASGAPAAGDAAIGQAHALAAATIATGVPAAGSATLAQAHALGAAALVTGAPSSGTAAVGQVHQMAASAVATGAPGIDAAAIGQAHQLSAPGVAPGAPSTGAAAIGQAHVLAASAIATGPPTLGAAAIGGSVPPSLTLGLPLPRLAGHAAATLPARRRSNTLTAPAPPPGAAPAEPR